MKHYSVLLKEVIDSLNIKPSGIYVDATLGYAGMSKKILEKLNDEGLLICIDQDEEAIKYSQKVLESISKRFVIVNDNFVNLKNILEKEGINKIDGIIFDLGFSSPQIDEEDRGFSFMKNSKLDMRMNQNQKFSAYDIVNDYSEEKLKEIFYNYGEEKTSSSIAKKIVSERKNKKIETTEELVDIIKRSTGANYFYKNHPERKIFQALRIEVNNELEVLESVLPDAIKLLKVGGRMSVISFHSLEDRIVKNVFKKYSEVNELVKGLPNIPDEYKPLIKVVNKKPIMASEEELKENSRSRSAKLRVIERI